MRDPPGLDNPEPRVCGQPGCPAEPAFSLAYDQAPKGSPYRESCKLVRLCEAHAADALKVHPDVELLGPSPVGSQLWRQAPTPSMRGRVAASRHDGGMLPKCIMRGCPWRFRDDGPDRPCPDHGSDLEARTLATHLAVLAAQAVTTRTNDTKTGRKAWWE
jgi:hypothetical protein